MAISSSPFPSGESSDSPSPRSPLGTQDSSRRIERVREYYGFTLYLVSLGLCGLYFGWALLPESILHQLGIYYYPNKNWALIVPIWIYGLIPFIILSFLALNLMQTPDLSDFCTVTDSDAVPYNHVHDQVYETDRIPDLEDVGISHISEILYLGYEKIPVSRKWKRRSESPPWKHVQGLPLTIVQED